MRHYSATILSVAVLLVAFGMLPASAGTPGEDAILLDPNDPVPEIGFWHGDYDGGACSHGRCRDDCDDFDRDHRERSDRDDGDHDHDGRYGDDDHHGDADRDRKPDSEDHHGDGHHGDADHDHKYADGDHHGDDHPGDGDHDHKFADSDHHGEHDADHDRGYDAGDHHGEHDAGRDRDARYDGDDYHRYRAGERERWRRRAHCLEVWRKDYERNSATFRHDAERFDRDDDRFDRDLKLFEGEAEWYDRCVIHDHCEGPRPPH